MLVVRIREQCLLQPPAPCVSNQAELGTELGVLNSPWKMRQDPLFNFLEPLKMQKNVGNCQIS